jgi:hypothetical protein
MEYKRQLEDERRRREREEEERMERRTREQQERIKREFDEEMAIKQAKEDAVNTGWTATRKNIQKKSSHTVRRDRSG